MECDVLLRVSSPCVTVARGFSIYPTVIVTNNEINEKNKNKIKTAPKGWKKKDEQVVGGSPVSLSF